VSYSDHLWSSDAKKGISIELSCTSKDIQDRRDGFDWDTQSFSILPWAEVLVVRH